MTTDPHCPTCRCYTAKPPLPAVHLRGRSPRQVAACTFVRNSNMRTTTDLAAVTCKNCLRLIVKMPPWYGR